MALLKVGLRPWASAGKLLGSAPAGLALPILPAPPTSSHRDLLFNPPTWKWHVNDQFEYMYSDRDWAGTIAKSDGGFLGWRNQLTWLRADGFYGGWEPAEREVRRAYRKGSTGLDARTLVLECGPNPGVVRVDGTERVVLWKVTDYNGGVRPDTAWNVAGYNIPLKSKLPLIGSTPSPMWNGEASSFLEVEMPADMPAIDFSPGGGPNGLRVRHWSFWKDSVAKTARRPADSFDYYAHQVINAGGWFNSGGAQGIPTWRDWTCEYRDFGSMTEELWRGEQEYLATIFDADDPRKVLIELENEPTREWADGPEGVGYGTLLRDVWYPIAREYHADRTIAVKSTAYGGLDSLIGEFTWTVPDGKNTFVLTHNYDGQATDPSGAKINWGTTAQANYYADQLAGAVARAGAHGGGMGEIGHRPWEWWDYGAAVSDEERGRRLGRMLTAANARGLFLSGWFRGGDANYCADLYGGPPDSARLELLWPGLRPYGSVAGQTV